MPGELANRGLLPEQRASSLLVNMKSWLKECLGLTACARFSFRRVSIPYPVARVNFAGDREVSLMETAKHQKMRASYNVLC